MFKKYKPKNEFRYNYDSKHPNYIFGESKNKYKSLGITHKETTFNKKNMPLKYNPNRLSKSKAYIRHGVITTKKSNYSKKLKNYRFADCDYKNVKSKIRNYKKQNKNFW